MAAKYIKHMAFAVKDVDAALKHYQDYLGVGLDARLIDAPKARIRVAIFNVGDVEYQLNQSMDEEGRFSTWINQRGHEGLHHICYAVDNIDTALSNAQAKGASSKNVVLARSKVVILTPKVSLRFSTKTQVVSRLK